MADWKIISLINSFEFETKSLRIYIFKGFIKKGKYFHNFNFVSNFLVKTCTKEINKNNNFSLLKLFLGKLSLLKLVCGQLKKSLSKF